MKTIIYVLTVSFLLTSCSSESDTEYSKCKEYGNLLLKEVPVKCLKYFQ